MAIVPFSLQASVGCPGYASLALALAAEFHDVDLDAAERALGDLADEAAAAGPGEPTEQLEALALIAGAFRARDGWLDTGDLFLDRVLETRRGHPVVVACVLVEAARRAGLEIGLVGDGMEVMLAHTATDNGYVLDLGDTAVRPVTNTEALRLRWRCSHQVAFGLLRELVDRSLRANDVATALHALELRLALPLDGDLRGRVEDERAVLKARLN